MYPRIRCCIRWLAPAVGFTLVVSCATPPAQIKEASKLPVRGPVYMPDQMSDPLEPLNRGIWNFNHGLLTYVVSPAGKGYRAVVPVPVRHSISNFGRNLVYPGRALNELLQGRIADAGNDSKRFLCNTTVGLLGFFDVASKWGVPKPRANFSQTFQKWGWEGDTYLMLPLFGPSDEVHATGFGMDLAADPMSYTIETRIISSGVRFNNLSDAVDRTLRQINSESDSYSTTKGLWTYASMDTAPDWSMHGPQDPATLQTLAVATIRVNDPKFTGLTQESKVMLSTTGKELPFNYWMQKGKAPLVYLIPGLGSHRLSLQALKVAEDLYQGGFSVVSVSGLLNPEFIKLASTAPVPGYAPMDRRDLMVVLNRIDAWMQNHFADQISRRAMVGCSMGGFQTLATAAAMYRQRGKSHETHQLQIDRFVAVNPPVDLHYGLVKLDAFQDAPSVWPKKLRQQRIDNTLHKVAALIATGIPKNGQIPIDGTESKYLIGLDFRLTLRNAIYTSQRKHNLGLLQHKLSYWRREPVYNEIMGISFAEYFKKFIIPAYRKEGYDTSKFKENDNLMFSSPELAKMDNVRVITTNNDFLLSPENLDWLKKTFGPKHLVLLNAGGHLGELASPAFPKLLLSQLAGMKSK